MTASRSKAQPRQFVPEPSSPILNRYAAACANLAVAMGLAADVRVETPVSPVGTPAGSIVRIHVPSAEAASPPDTDSRAALLAGILKTAGAEGTAIGACGRRGALVAGWIGR